MISIIKNHHWVLLIAALHLLMTGSSCGIKTYESNPMMGNIHRIKFVNKNKGRYAYVSGDSLHEIPFRYTNQDEILQLKFESGFEEIDSQPQESSIYSCRKIREADRWEYELHFEDSMNRFIVYHSRFKVKDSEQNTLLNEDVMLRHFTFSSSKPGIVIQIPNSIYTGQQINVFHEQPGVYKLTILLLNKTMIYYETTDKGCYQTVAPTELHLRKENLENSETLTVHGNQELSFRRLK